MKFTKILKEAMAISDVDSVPRNKPVTVVVGRFQPPTIGHEKMFELASKKDYPVFVVVVKSESKKSPFDVNTVEKMLKNVAPVHNVISLQNAFIGEFVTAIRKKGFEPRRLVVGTDRIKDFDDALKRYSEKFNLDIELIETIRTDEDVSASKVRKALADGNEEDFKKMINEKNWKYFDVLRKSLK